MQSPCERPAPIPADAYLAAARLCSDCDNVVETCRNVELTDDLKKLFFTVGMSTKAIQHDPSHNVLQSDGRHRQPTAAEAVSILEQAKQKLDQLSFLPAKNAFVARCIRFGLDPPHIWGANPVDLMHAFQSGIVRYLVKMIVDKLSTAKQVALDRLVHKLFHNLHCKENLSAPG